MNTLAVVLEEPERLGLSRLALTPPTDADVVVDIEWSGISTGTERLLYSGRMPAFPGLGYPLVPGYESVGTVSFAGVSSQRSVGERVFVPGARCYGDVRGLFGGAAARVVVPGARAVPIQPGLGDTGVLLALAATAHHALDGEAGLPDLIVGHGVLGRLLARIAVAYGASPVVWECDPLRRSGASGYTVIEPEADTRRDYGRIVDASGDPDLLDTLIARLAPGGEVGRPAQPAPAAAQHRRRSGADERRIKSTSVRTIHDGIAWVSEDRLHFFRDGSLMVRPATMNAP